MHGLAVIALAVYQGTRDFFGQENHIADQVLFHLGDVFCTLQLREVVVDLAPATVLIHPVSFCQLLVQLGCSLH